MTTSQSAPRGAWDTTADAGAARLLDDLLAGTREALLVTDPRGLILRASAAASTLLGVDAAGLEGRQLVELVDADERASFEAALAADAPPELRLRLSPRRGKAIDVVLLKRTGASAVVWALAPAPDPAAADDASERALRGVRVARLVDELVEAVVSVDRGMHVEFANAGARTLLGLTVGATLPERWEQFDLSTFAAALFVPEALHAEALVRTVDGRSFTLIGMPTEARESVVLLLADTSGREQREQAQRDFVANAAHELRTPITGIAGAVEVLQAGAKDDPETLERFLGHIARESARLVRLVNSLLVLARTNVEDAAVAMSPLPVRPLLDDVAARLRPRPGVGVEVLCPPDLRALADRDLVERALDNLAGNAAKFTQRGRILLEGRHDRRGAVLEIHDSGPGMTAEVRARVFERFYRGAGRGDDGFGLGLPIALQAVEAVGGALELDADPRGGTIARIVLREPEAA